jgi:hypothetical protein
MADTRETVPVTRTLMYLAGGYLRTAILYAGHLGGDEVSITAVEMVR